MDKNIKLLADNIERVIAGKRRAVEEIIAALLAGGHALIEDVPGVGKTQLASALARSIGGKFNRLQLTPDIMPSDITGFSMVDRESGELSYKPGAAFCNILLADEINRASPKTQSALLEIMEERQISVDGHTHPLPSPHMVIATENPVETYGTYHLPEAQMDRFAVKISIGYPDYSTEMDILSRNEYANPIEGITEVMSTEDVIALQKQAADIHASDALRRYIIDIAGASRHSDKIKLGISPRGSIMLLKVSKAFAFIAGREYVTPDDVKRAGVITLAHRLTLSPKGKSLTPAEAVGELFANVLVPLS
jgi:MoxR-like ATPase